MRQTQKVRAFVQEVPAVLANGISVPEVPDDDTRWRRVRHPDRSG